MNAINACSRCGARANWMVSGGVIYEWCSHCSQQRELELFPESRVAPIGATRTDDNASERDQEDDLPWGPGEVSSEEEV